MKSQIDIIRIKEIYRIEKFKVYCQFMNDELRFVDFEELFKKWNIDENDIEYKLLDENEFQKVKISNGVFTWENISISLIDENGSEKLYPYDIDPKIIYENSKLDNEKILENFGMLIRSERIKSGMTMKQLAKKSGISEEYISKIESEKSNIELLLVRDILQNGFGKRLKIEIE